MAHLEKSTLVTSFPFVLHGVVVSMHQKFSTVAAATNINTGEDVAVKMVGIYHILTCVAPFNDFFFVAIETPSYCTLCMVIAVGECPFQTPTAGV